MTTRRQFLIGSVASAATMALPVPVVDYDLMMTPLSSWPFMCRCTVLMGRTEYEKLRAMDVVRTDDLFAVGDKVFGRIGAQHEISVEIVGDAREAQGEDV